MRLPKLSLGSFPMPHPMEKAPHQDAGELVVGVAGTLEGVGGYACDLLDKPFDATVKIKGPHRLVDGALDTVGGQVKGIVKSVTRP